MHIDHLSATCVRRSSAVLVSLGLVGVAFALTVVGRAADATHGDAATISVGTATVVPSGTVTVDITIIPNANGAPETFGSCGNGGDDDADGDIDDGCPLGAIEMIIGYNSLEVFPTSCTMSSGVCNTSMNPVTFSAANLSGLSGVVGTLTLQAGPTQLTSTLNAVISVCSDLQGSNLTCGAENGTVTIVQATPTATPTPSIAPTLPPATTPAITATPPITPTPNTDFDQDGVPNLQDNCPFTANGPSQASIPGVGNQTDTDGDGIPGKHPNYNEPFGGDACDFDDDNDEVPDGVDECRTSVEDLDQHEDRDGCPDADNDRDGVCDEGLDAVFCTGSDVGRTAFFGAGHNHLSPEIDCRNLPEDRDAFHDEDGCPEADNDNDGFPDSDDRCDGNDHLAGADGVLGSGEDQDHDGILDAGEDSVVVDGALTADDSARSGEDHDGVLDTDGCYDAIWGDTNCGGSVDSTDALRILRYAAGLANTVIPGCPFNGDVNCDGATTSVDALKVLRYASGLTDAVMPGCLEIGK